jgi:hypothetical protein
MEGILGRLKLALHRRARSSVFFSLFVFFCVSVAQNTVEYSFLSQLETQILSAFSHRTQHGVERRDPVKPCGWESDLPIGSHPKMLYRPVTISRNVAP